MKQKSLLTAAILLLLGAQSVHAARFLETCNGRPTGHKNATLALSASDVGFPSGGIWDTALRVAISRGQRQP